MELVEISSVGRGGAIRVYQPGPRFCGSYSLRSWLLFLAAILTGLCCGRESSAEASLQPAQRKAQSSPAAKQSLLSKTRSPSHSTVVRTVSAAPVGRPAAASRTGGRRPHFSCSAQGNGTQTIQSSRRIRQLRGRAISRPIRRQYGSCPPRRPARHTRPAHPDRRAIPAAHRRSVGKPVKRWSVRRISPLEDGPLPDLLQINACLCAGIAGGCWMTFTRG